VPSQRKYKVDVSIPAPVPNVMLNKVGAGHKNTSPTLDSAWTTLLENI
jgi:hypothetical protein